MKTRRIPQTELRPSVLGYGVAEFGTRIAREEAVRLVAEYLRLGGNFLDTAHCYAYWVGGLGESERVLGAAVRELGCRRDVVVATKGGHPPGDGYPRPERWLGPEAIRSDVAESLERLGMDSVDLYYLHRDDRAVPVAEIIDALNVEVDAGHIRHLGASNWSVMRMKEANRYAQRSHLEGFVASQVQWSLAVPDWKIGPDPTIRYVRSGEWEWHAQTGVPIVAYSAAANGYFAAEPPAEGQFAGPENAVRHRRARELAEELGCTPTQVAVAWLLHQKPVSVYALFSTASRTHMAEVMASPSVQLTPEQADRLGAR